MASGSVPDQPTESDGLFAGFLTVAPWRVPILFLRSLHPGYIPPGTQPSAQPDKGPACTFGSPGGQDSSFFQGVELAARLVSPYTVLPAEIRTMLEGIVTFSAATRFRDLLGAFGATEGSPPTESRADISEDGSPTNDKDRKNKKPQQTRQRTSPPATTSIGTGQLPKTAVALGALSSLSAAAAASPSGNKTEGWIDVPNATTLGKIGDQAYPLFPPNGSQVTASAQTSTPEAMTTSAHTLTSSSTPPTVTQQTIEVNDTETLGKIGSDPKYPPDGTYIQTKDIDARNLSRPISRFTGQYNGQNYTTTIANLGCCLVDTVEDGGTISNLHFTGANIISASRPAGVVACGVSGNGTIRDIYVENSQVITTGNDADAGIGAGVLSGRAVVDILARNSTVLTHGEGADAGIGSGSIGNDAAISHVEALICLVKTVGNNANAAIGAGYVNGTVASTSAIWSEVTTSGNGSHAAIGGGKVDNGGTVTNTTAFVNGVKTTGDQANAGVGAGAMGRGTVVANTLGQGCEVSTSGDGANAGIGAGRMGRTAMLKNTSAERFASVATFGAEANAGIGAGLMDPGARIAGTRSLESRVETTGDRANAGIGAGAMGNGTGIANTLAKNSKVSTSGDGANAGIGAGKMGRSAWMENTSAQCFSSVTTSGAEANAGIGAGFMDPRARIVGTRSHNSEVETSGVRAHAGIGAGMIRGNASVTDTRAVNPRATAAGNNASADIGAGRIEPGGVVTNTTEVYTGWPGVLACEPVIPATASSTAMSFPGATMTLPTSAAPLANTLSNGAIAGITLGAAVALALAGVVGGYIYRHCYRRPSPADDGAPQNENRQNA